MDDLRRAARPLAIALGVSGCGWVDLDAVAPGATDTEAPDARLASQDAAGAPVKASDAADHPNDATQAVDAPNGDALLDAEPPAPSSAACNPDDVTLYAWTFDSTLEIWTMSLDTGVTASFVWTGSAGYPALGAASVQISPLADDAGTPNGGWIEYPHSFGDLTGRTVSAWVWLESGTSPYLQVFAKTGAQYVWGDNGTVQLRPKVWTCVSLPVSTPYYNQPGYDPSDVVTIGYLFLGSTPFTVYLDTVNIY